MTLKWSSTPGDMILSPTADPLYNTNSFPSLDLQFATTKTLNDEVSGTPLVSHQRDMSGSNGAGTFVNSSGLIEESKVNLMTYSEQFDQWTAASNTVLTPNKVAAPDGTLTADQIYFSLSPNTNISQNVTLTQNQQYTFSVYAKAVTPGVDNQFAPYINSPIPHTPGSAFVATSEWQRFSFTFTHVNPTASTGVFIINLADAYITNVYLWGAQLETGSTATTYIPTTNVPSAAPRFDHDPVTGESLGLLVEESRTNLVAYSERFDQSAWTKSNASIILNATSAPDGTLTANKLVESSVLNNTYKIFQQVSGGNNTYINSVYVKQAESDRHFYIEVGGCRAGINLTDGSVFFGPNTFGSGWSNPQVFVSSVGDGWYRVTISGDADATITTVTSKMHVATLTGAAGGIVYDGDGTSGVYIWGNQLEQGSFPTSYIPTTSSAVTRAADVAEITGTNFSSWYNQSEGTMCSTVTAYSGSQWRSNLVMDTALGAATRLQVLHQDATDRLFYGAGFATLTPNVSTGQVFKSVWANDGSAVSAASNGSSVVTLSGAITQTMNGLGIGSLLGVGGTFGNGHISRLTYYPYRLPDAKLQTITS